MRVGKLFCCRTAVVALTLGLVAHTVTAAPLASLKVTATPVVTGEAGAFADTPLSTPIDIDLTSYHLGGTKYFYQGNHFQPNGLNINFVSSVNTNPKVSNDFVVTNLSDTTYSVEMEFEIELLSDAITVPTFTGGSVDIDVRDFGDQDLGGGVYAEILNDGSTPMYMSQINGVDYIPLLANTQIQVTGPFETESVDDVFGNVPTIPSLPGPSNVNSIGIVITFLLSPEDTASVVSSFVVEPIPEPATATLAVLGLTFMLRRPRRQNSRKVG